MRRGLERPHIHSADLTRSPTFLLVLSYVSSCDRIGTFSIAFSDHQLINCERLREARRQIT